MQAQVGVDALASDREVGVPAVVDVEVHRVVGAEDDWRAGGAEGAARRAGPRGQRLRDEVSGRRRRLWWAERPRAAVVGIEQAVLDRVDRLRLAVHEIVGAEQLPRAHVHDGVLTDPAEFRPGGDRLRNAARVLQGGEALCVVYRRRRRGGGLRDVAVDVEAPEVAELVTAVDALRGVVGVGEVRPGRNACQAAGRRGVAGTGRDRAQQRTVARPEDEQVTAAVTRRDVVVSRGDDDHPGAVLELGDHRVAVAVAEVVVGEFPEALRRCRVGDVERVVAAAAVVEAADENRLPYRWQRSGCRSEAIADADVAGHRRAIDGELMHVLRTIVLVGELEQAREDRARDVGPRLFAGAGVEGVQHAVVGSGIDHRRTRLVGGLEAGVVVVGVVPR
ncbi:MAG: hypothetical protein AW07_02117 [Candidatus Accumulibacter sp. SK-11]|nr:MAG: hypothetical protein AW07_02117 [Candidatus Accumulibacter sp. SK-11]